MILHFSTILDGAACFRCEYKNEILKLFILKIVLQNYKIHSHIINIDYYDFHLTIVAPHIFHIYFHKGFMRVKPTQKKNHKLFVQMLILKRRHFHRHLAPYYDLLINILKRSPCVNSRSLGVLRTVVR